MCMCVDFIKAHVPSANGATLGGGYCYPEWGQTGVSPSSIYTNVAFDACGPECSILDTDNIKEGKGIGASQVFIGTYTSLSKCMAWVHYRIYLGTYSLSPDTTNGVTYGVSGSEAGKCYAVVEQTGLDTTNDGTVWQNVRLDACDP